MKKHAPTRTVRLDDETSEALDEIVQTTGKPMSWAFKRGLLLLRERLAEEASPSPYEVFETLDLGPGGYAASPASKAKVTAREAILAKHRRKYR